MPFVTVADVSELPAGATLAVVVDGREIGLFNCAGSIYATADICSHAFAELHEGELDSDDCTIECPLHGARFDLASGRPLSLPATEPIAVYPVRIEGTAIQVQVDAE